MVSKFLFGYYADHTNVELLHSESFLHVLLVTSSVSINCCVKRKSKSRAAEWHVFLHKLCKKARTCWRFPAVLENICDVLSACPMSNLDWLMRLSIDSGRPACIVYCYSHYIKLWISHPKNRGFCQKDQSATPKTSTIVSCAPFNVWTMFHGRHGHGSRMAMVLRDKIKWWFQSILHQKTKLWTTFQKLITPSKIVEIQCFLYWGVEKLFLLPSDVVKVLWKSGQDTKKCLDWRHRNLTHGPFSEGFSFSIQIY